MAKEFADISEALTGYPLDRVVVFDTETTGLKPYEGDEILSISIVDGYGQKILATYVRPKAKKSWPDAQRVNRITPDSVASAPTIDEFAGQIREAFADKLVVGYNVQFDIDFLIAAGVLERPPMHVFDVMKQYAAYVLGGGRWIKLTDCAHHYKYKFKAHAADEDAIATAWCYRALLTDPAYIRVRLGSRELHRATMSQIKETKANILELSDAGMATVLGELRQGAITRGRNKGALRYEAFANDKRVGIGSASWVDDARSIFGGDLPQTIPCKVTLDASDREKPQCNVEIDSGFGEEPILALAKSSQALWSGKIYAGDGWLDTYLRDTNAGSDNLASSAAADETKNKGGCSGCFVVIAGIVIASIVASIIAYVFWLSAIK